VEAVFSWPARRDPNKLGLQLGWKKWYYLWWNSSHKLGYMYIYNPPSGIGGYPRDPDFIVHKMVVPTPPVAPLKNKKKHPYHHD
jgi:hypothetical protein